jgi:site-specific DNA recombinase
MAREAMISPDIQRAIIGACAQASGRKITGWVEDLDDTGRNFRRKVQQAIARIEAGEAAEIIAWRYDRWGRNTREALLNIERVEAVGGSVVSATEPVDPAKAFGKYSRTNLLAQAELQSDLIGEGWANAHANRQARGMTVNGTPRFGYRRLGKVPDPERAHVYRRDPADPEGERYEPDPVNGPALRELYVKFTSGAGTTRLLKWLAEQGVTTTRGASFSAVALLRVLDSGFGAGLLRVHDPACGCTEWGKCRRYTWIPGGHEPVITEPQWQAYRRAREDRAKAPPRSRDPAYPLSGLVKCSCGASCVAAFSNGQRGYGYRCQAWVQHRGCPGVFARRSVVEAEVLAWLSAVSADISEQSAARKARARVAADSEKLARKHTAAVARIDAELKRLVLRSVTEEGIPAEVWDAARAQLTGAREEASGALEAVSRTLEASAADFEPVMRELLDGWDLLPPGRRRELLSRLIRKVELTRTGVRTRALIRVVPLWESQDSS